MAPVCESQHRLDSLDEENTDSFEGSVEITTCRGCGATLPKRSSLWPKNTSTYHRRPLSIRSDALSQPPHLLQRSGSEFTTDNSGDNTTVIIGSVVGVVLIVLAFGIVTCCCLAARKSKCRKKKKKKTCCRGKDKEKKKDKDKDKETKKDKDEPYRGQPCGTYQQVNDWLNFHNMGQGMVMPGMPPMAYQGDFGGQGGMGNEMNAPQMGYGRYGF